MFIGKKALKGRGALSNPAGRFDRTELEGVDDGWYAEELPDSIAVTVETDHARTVISTNDSPDVGFDYSINPYRGCEHGCIYCYARPSHAYLGLSPGLDFETRLFYKPDAARLLRAELSRPGYVCKPIMLGANTDPYQPVEKRLGVTRSILEVLAEHRHPVSIITKSALVVRDLDLLSPMARENLAGVAVSVMVAPVIPAITDHELEAILEAAAGAGAKCAGYVLLRLPYEVKDLFREWLAEHHPLRAKHVMSLVNDARGGRDNDPNFGTRMTGTGPLAELLKNRFTVACRRFGLQSLRSFDFDTARFVPPGKPASPQLDLGF
jgi:DNA repair photolyase